MDTVVDPPLDGIDAIDALCAAGFPDHVIRSAAAQWHTWSMLAAATALERRDLGWVARRGALPQHCPPARAARIGRLVTYRDALWPAALERLEDPPAICDLAGGFDKPLHGFVGNCRGGRDAAAIRAGVEAAGRNGFGIVADTDPTGMIALRHAVACGIETLVVLHGDGNGNGGIGGVQARWIADQSLDTAGAAIHIRGGLYGDHSRIRAARCVVALSTTLDVYATDASTLTVDASTRCADVLGIPHRMIRAR